MTRLIQLTDLHIGQTNEDTHGIDVRQNFKNTLAAIADIGADALVISGDLCYRDGQIPIYKWIKTQLDQQPLPYYLIGGNHDDSKMIAQVFGLEDKLHQEGIYYRIDLANNTLIFLDTVKAVLGAQQLEWFQGQLLNSQQQVLIFMHHPPTLAGVPFMDNRHCFKSITDFQTILAQFPDKRFTTFSGHYHVGRTIQNDNATMYITPSTFFQISPFKVEFEVDTYDIAWRLIDINKQENLLTAVHWLAGTSLNKS